MSQSPLDLRFDHLAHPAFDVAATRHFYAEILGLPLTAAFEGESPIWGGRFLHFAFAFGPEGQIDFFALDGLERPAEALPVDLRHLALRVVSRAALAAWRERLQAQGVAVREEAHGEDRSLYFEDPNGITLELRHRPEPASTDDPTRAAAVVRGWLEARA